MSDDDLAKALDRVLSLSGGDFASAEAALKERAAARRKKPGTHVSATTSPTISSVSSLTASDQLPGERVLTERAHSRPVQVSHRGSKAEPPAKQSQWLHEVQTESSVSKSQPPTRSKSTTLLIISDSEGETTTSTCHSARRERPLSPVEASLPVVAYLPRLLAGITAEESKLSSEVFYAARSAISSDPNYLGGPEHISLHNSSGSCRYREVVYPPLNPPTPVTKWYIVTCGTRVGIFIDWTPVSQCVTRVSGAIHKHYKSEKEAYLWFQYALLRGSLKLMN